MSARNVSDTEASSLLESLTNQMNVTESPILSLQTVSPAQLDSIVNVTREFPLNYAIIMFGYLLPAVLVVSIVTNCLVVAVLYQRHMRTPTNIVLLMMAIVDLATLLSPSPWYLYIYTLGNHDKFLYPPAACYAHHLMTDVVPVFFHTSSIWLALLLASQRYIYVCHPTLARTWCTVPRVKRAICAILAVAFLHQLTRFFDNTFTAVRVEIGGVSHPACRNEIAEWVHVIEVPRYYTTYFTFRILFVFIFPCTALISLNCLLFRALKRAETKRTMLLKTKFKIVGADPTQATLAGRMSSPNIFAAARSQTMSYAPRPLTIAPTTCTAASPDQQLQQERRRRRRSSDQSSVAQKADSGLVAAADRTNQADERSARSEASAGSSPAAAAAAAASNLVASTPGRNLAHLALLTPCKVADFKPSENDAGDQLTKGQLDRVVKPAMASKGAEEQKRRRRSAMSRTIAANSGFYSDNQSATSASSEASQSGSNTSRSASSRSSATTAQTTKTDDDDDDEEEEDDDDDEDDGDLSTCAECAAEMRRSCRHCSMALDGVVNSAASGAVAASTYEELNTNTSAICEHHHKPNYQQQNQKAPLHQPVSQCSSILGGATNTTNEEDNSSCLATQNMSSSMLAPAAATLDAIETSSMHCSEEDVDEQAHGDELLVDCKLGEAAMAQEELSSASRRERLFRLSQRLPNFKSNSSHQLIKSGSIDSRLACGCLSGKTMALRRIRSMSKHRRESRIQEAGGEFDCQAGSSGGPSCWTPDNWPAQQQQQPQLQQSRAGCLGAVETEAPPGQTRDSVGLLMGQSVGPSRAQQVATSSVQARGLKQVNATEQRQQRESSQTIVFQPTTTTTTTLISANSSANSLVPINGGAQRQSGDLLSGQSGQKVLMVSQKSEQTGEPLQVEACRGQQQERRSQRIGSPSFACHVSGRGSRTTLLGSGNPACNPETIPMIVSSQHNAAAPHSATTRSMDSNRTTLMLVVVVSVFLFVEVPVALMTIAHVILNTFDVFKDFEFNNYLNYIKLITNFMIMISYSVNFTIYCSMSKRFRETFRDLFYCGGSGLRRRRSKRLFSQSQAAHCNQLSAHPIGPASTMMTTMMNHSNQSNQNNNNNDHHHQNHLGLGAARASKQQLTDLTRAASNQNLITSGLSSARRLNERVHSHYECEL